MFSYSKRYVSAFPPRSPEKAAGVSKQQKRRRRSSGGTYSSCVSTASSTTTSTPPPGIIFPPNRSGPPHVSKNRMATGSNTSSSSSEEDGSCAAVTVITAGMPGLVAASSAETDETGSERFYTPCGTFVSECDSKDDVPLGVSTVAEPDRRRQEEQQRQHVEQSVMEDEGKPGAVDGEDSAVVEGKAADTTVAKKQPSFHKSSSFIRVADLDLQALRSDASDALMAQRHDSLPAPPPPHVCPDPSDRDCWVGLDMVTSDGLSHSAYVPLVVGALVRAGLHAVGDEGMWTPADRATKKLVAERSKGGRHTTPLSPQSGTSVDKEVMVWTGTFPHRHYGHDLPAVRSRGVVAMSPSDLATLLLDSDRVGEYNKNSLGRTDDVVFGDHDLHSTTTSSPLGVTKVTRSRAKVPLVSRALEFVSLLHGRRLVDGDGMGEGYVVVARAVTPSDECHHPDGTGGDDGVIRSEILMNVHLIRSLEGESGNVSDKCEMINISHLKSPMVPMFVAKKLGLTAAVSFINDIRALC